MVVSHCDRTLKRTVLCGRRSFCGGGLNSEGLYIRNVIRHGEKWSEVGGGRNSEVRNWEGPLYDDLKFLSTCLEKYKK